MSQFKPGDEKRIFGLVHKVGTDEMMEVMLQGPDLPRPWEIQLPHDEKATAMDSGWRAAAKDGSDNGKECRASNNHTYRLLDLRLIGIDPDGQYVAWSSGRAACYSFCEVRN